MKLLVYNIRYGTGGKKPLFPWSGYLQRTHGTLTEITEFIRPMEPDIHWSAMSGHVSTFIVNGGRYNKIFWTETFNDGMQEVLSAIDTPHRAASRVSTNRKVTDQSARTRSKIISTTCPCT